MPEQREINIFKIAQMLEQGEDYEDRDRIVETPIEKVARAVAIIETVQAINRAEEIDNFEKKAMERGYSQEEVKSFMEERGMVPFHKILSIPESLR